LTIKEGRKEGRKERREEKRRVWYLIGLGLVFFWFAFLPFLWKELEVVRLFGR